MRHLFFLWLLCSPFLSEAQIYKTVDEDGNVTFTDSPEASKSKKPEPVDLPPLNTQPPPPLPTKSESSKTEKKKTASPNHYGVTIVSPKDQSSILPDQRDLAISAAVTPKLAPGHQIEIRVNGKTVAKGDSTNVTLEEISRGSHQIHVHIVNQDGKLISSARPVTVYVRRPSVAK